MIEEHYKEALQYFPEDKIVGLFLQGSQNYNLDLPTSDVDTKLITLPSFKDIALNRKAVSTTHVRANNEHIDFKDIRLYMDTFRKQNLNFLEILFTDYKIINPNYASEWQRLISARESIARMNPWRAVKSMKGIALEKYHAMEHEYPSKVDILKKFGYDPKQLHHLLRVEDYLVRYIDGEEYEKCLKPSKELKNHLIAVKLGCYDLETARKEAERARTQVIQVADYFCSQTQDNELEWCRELLEDVSYNIMKISIKKELEEENVLPIH